MKKNQWKDPIVDEVRKSFDEELKKTPVGEIFQQFPQYYTKSQR